MSGPAPIPEVDRFWQKVSKPDGDSGCWTWTGTVSRGYGLLGLCGRTTGQVRAHRFAYELLVGPIPADLTLDHTCHTADTSCAGGEACLHRRCVNPAHLEPVTRAENVMRGRGHGPVNAQKDTCVKGHPYDAENTKWTKEGWRRCRECYRLKDRAARERRQAEREDARAEVERLRLHANSARVCLERFRVRPESTFLLATALQELDDALAPVPSKPPVQTPPDRAA